MALGAPCFLSPGESGQPVPESLGATAMEMEVLADLQESASKPHPWGLVQAEVSCSSVSDKSC